MSVTAVIRNVQLNLYKKHYTYRAQLAASSLHGHTNITADGFEDGVLVNAVAPGEAPHAPAPEVPYDPKRKYPVACEQVSQQTTLAVKLTMVKLLEDGKKQEIKKYEQLVLLENEGPEKCCTVTFGEVGKVKFHVQAMFTLRWDQEKDGGKNDWVPAINTMGNVHLAKILTEEGPSAASSSGGKPEPRRIQIAAKPSSSCDVSDHQSAHEPPPMTTTAQNNKHQEGGNSNSGTETTALPQEQQQEQAAGSTQNGAATKAVDDNRKNGDDDDDDEPPGAVKSSAATVASINADVVTDDAASPVRTAGEVDGLD